MAAFASNVKLKAPAAFHLRSPAQTLTVAWWAVSQSWLKRTKVNFQSGSTSCNIKKLVNSCTKVCFHTCRTRCNPSKASVLCGTSFKARAWVSSSPGLNNWSPAAAEVRETTCYSCKFWTKFFSKHTMMCLSRRSIPKSRRPQRWDNIWAQATRPTKTSLRRLLNSSLVQRWRKCKLKEAWCVLMKER